MPTMNAEQTAEMTDTINTYAKNGSIEKKKIGMVFRAVGLNPTEGQLADWKKECGGGDADVSKFTAVAMKKFEESNDSSDEIVDCFSVFDKDGNGTISAAEFKHILTNMGEALSEKEIAEVMKEVDIGAGGMIDYKAFASEIFSSN